MSQTLVVLAAGMSSRYGGNKQLAAIGPNNEVLLDYAVFDAVRAGFSDVALVIRRELENDFQEHVTRRFADRVQVSFAYQELDDLPAGCILPSSRKKPWGTGHAILAIRNLVGDPFVVINADDFYGRSAYSSLYEFREVMQQENRPDFAMVGYTLSDTLSSTGGVSRGICECNQDGYLERVVEVKEIAHYGEQIAGVTTRGELLHLQGNETVSMNIWALTPDVFPNLEKQFGNFLTEYASDTDAEFLISTALHEQIDAGRARLKVIAAQDPWFGMTFQADGPIVVSEIAALTKKGAYPSDLSTWFRGKR